MAHRGHHGAVTVESGTGSPPCPLNPPPPRRTVPTTVLRVGRVPSPRDDRMRPRAATTSRYAPSCGPRRRTVPWTRSQHSSALLNRTGELSRPGDEALRAAAVARPLEEVRQLVTLLNETPHDTGEAGTTLRAAAMGRSIEDVAELVAILGMDHGTRSGTGSMTVPGAESGNQPRPESGTEPRPESATEATEADTGTEAPFGTEPQSTPFGTEPQEPLSTPFGTEAAERRRPVAPFGTEPQAPLSTEFGTGVRRGPPRAVRRGRAVGGRSFPRLSPRLRRTPRRPRHHPLRHG